MNIPHIVTPANAGAQNRRVWRLQLWIPAFAGMTGKR
jgi:hypothetical protein